MERENNTMRLRSTLMHAFGMLALMLGALTLSAPAFADNIIPAPGLGSNSAWTVYAFGNAQAVSDAFRALANFSASAMFQSIVGLVAMAGVLAVGMTSGFSGAVAKRFIGYVVGVFLVCYIFFGIGSGGPVVVQVEVQDTVGGTWVAPVNVPAVVGIPASVISTAGYEITKQIEASFPLPDALKMSNGAPFNLPAALLADAGKARITDPNLASSLAYYVQDCVITAMARGSLQASVLLTSTDFINDINVNMPSVYVNTLLSNPVGSPNVVDCNTGWSLINSAVNAQGTTAADFLRSASAWASTPALNVVNSAADSVGQWSSNNGITDGGAMVKQSAVLAQFNGAFRQAAAATGNSDFLTGLALSQARETQTTGWITSAEVFNRTMGYIFAILQVFVYGITPLVLAAALVPGLGLALLKNFGQILLWLAIWQPMLAVVNFIVISMQQADLGGALNNGLGQYGFTLTNMGIISEKTSNMRAAAVFFGTMVPAFALALVKGSMDFSRIVGAAVGEHFAHQAATTMASGNYSLNQASMDSFTSNKQSIGHTGDWGFGQVSTGQGGMMSKHEMGGIGGVASGDQSARLTMGASSSVGSGGQLARTAGSQVGGSTGYTATDSGSLTHAGGTTDTAGSSNAASTSTSTSISAGINPLAAAVGRGGPGASQTALAAGGGGGGEGAQQGSTPGQFGKTPGLGQRLASALNTNVGIAGQASSTDTRNASHSTQTSTSGQTSHSGAVTHSGTTGATRGTSASESDNYQRSMNENVSGIAGLTERYEAIRPAMEFHSRLDRGYYAEKGTADYAWAHGSANSSVSQTANQVAQPNAVDSRLKSMENEIGGEKARLEKSADAQFGTAKKKEAEYHGQGAGAVSSAAAALPAEQAKAKQGALSLAKDAVVSNASELGEGAKDLFKGAVEGAMTKVQKATEAMGAKLDTVSPKLAEHLPQGLGGHGSGNQAATSGGTQQARQQPMTQPATLEAPQVQLPLAQPAPAYAASLMELTPPPQPNAQHGGNSLANAFSGHSAQENGGGPTQGQVQMAEQRSEQLSNKLKSVDNLLIGAEDKGPKEMAEVIRQAQDATRRN